MYLFKILQTIFMSLNKMISISVFFKDTVKYNNKTTHYVTHHGVTMFNHPFPLKISRHLSILCPFFLAEPFKKVENTVLLRRHQLISSRLRNKSLYPLCPLCSHHVQKNTLRERLMILRSSQTSYGFHCQHYFYVSISLLEYFSLLTK